MAVVGRVLCVGLLMGGNTKSVGQKAREARFFGTYYIKIGHPGTSLNKFPKSGVQQPPLFFTIRSVVFSSNFRRLLTMIAVF